MRLTRFTLRLGGATVLSLALSVAAAAQSITPSTYSRSILKGESFTLTKTITLPAAGATTVDLFFLIDNTGSMYGTIDNAKNGATAIMNALPGTYQFGAAEYRGDPSEYYPSHGLETPFQIDAQLSSNKATTQAGINSMYAAGGDDWPEANFYALQQLSQQALWRPEAQRLIAWFGDAPSHTETTTEAQAIAALQAANAKVIAFNAYGAGGGIDDCYGGSCSQSSSIVAAVGGLEVNGFNPGTNFVDAVVSQITASTHTLDLRLFSSFVGSGLEISFVCSDALGCDAVEGGQSRTFDMTIKGLEVGTYDFTVYARGVDALETDHITVTEAGAVPEPFTMVLLGTGLAGLGAARRRRKVVA